MHIFKIIFTDDVKLYLHLHFEIYTMHKIRTSIINLVQ